MTDQLPDQLSPETLPAVIPPEVYPPTPFPRRRSGVVALDIETTGRDRKRHEVIAIGLVWLDDDLTELDAERHLIHPLHPHTGEVEAFAINGYDPGFWTNAHHPHLFAPELHEALRGVTVLSFNEGFDLAFLGHFFAAVGLTPAWNPQTVCVYRVAREMKSRGELGSASLIALCEHLGVALRRESYHDCLYDARATADCARALHLHHHISGNP